MNSCESICLVMFIQEAKQVAFNFRLQQMCHYKKQKFTHDQNMTSYYIVYNFTVSLKPLEIIQSFQRNVEERKHLLRWANIKKKPRATRQALNCCWLGKWISVTCILIGYFEGNYISTIGHDDNLWYQFPANPEKKHAFTCPSPTPRPPSFF